MPDKAQACAVMQDSFLWQSFKTLATTEDLKFRDTFTIVDEVDRCAEWIVERLSYEKVKTN